MSNIKFDELKIAGRKAIYEMVDSKNGDLINLEKGLLVKAKIWSTEEDQIILDNMVKGNFALIALKINEHNKINLK